VGYKRATLQHPSWIEVGWQVFPVVDASQAVEISHCRPLLDANRARARSTRLG
jgi:hypothetical protein